MNNSHSSTSVNDFQIHNHLTRLCEAVVHIMQAGLLLRRESARNLCRPKARLLRSVSDDLRDLAKPLLRIAEEMKSAEQDPEHIGTIAARAGKDGGRASDWRCAVSSQASQRAQILGLLIAARGDWVPVPKITACAAQYNARIFELRRLGFRITNRTREVNGQRHSWFRLESTPANSSPPGEIRNLTVATTGSFPEFGILAPESGYPD